MLSKHKFISNIILDNGTKKEQYVFDLFWRFRENWAYISVLDKSLLTAECASLSEEWSKKIDLRI